MSFELAAKTVEKVSTDVGKNKKFNPDKRAEKVDIKNRETVKKFDPDKRMEPSAAQIKRLENAPAMLDGSYNPAESKVSRFNPDLRMEKTERNGVSDAEKKETLEKKGLSEKEKMKIREEQGWSDEIINHIDSMEQYEIYKNADLHEAIIDGRTCLVKDINMDYVDPKTGFTNKELMQKGRAPIDSKTGEKIELHHMGQDYNGPFAELCGNSEHGDGNDIILHDKTKESWRHDPEKSQGYERDRKNHWKTRVEE